jgi:translation initiation factor IF-1
MICSLVRTPLRFLSLTGATSLAVLLVTWGATSPTLAAEPVSATSSPATSTLQTVKGDILNIEGDQMVVKDISGHEVRLHISNETRMDRVKVGDKVHAVVTADGHAQTVQIQMPQ